jgi:hypothetical protein
LQIAAVLIVSVPAVFGLNNRSAVSLSGLDTASCTVPDPCRTFDVAISKTNIGGEVVVLSTAGYGPFTVTQSVSVISPPAFHAALAPTTGTGITVNAPGATVILRNLYLNSLGAGTGISITTGTIVHIEGLVINGFTLNGIEINGMIGGTAEVFVKDSEIRDNSASGIYAGTSTGTAAVTVDHTRLERNTYGLAADSGVNLTVRDTVAARNASNGFWFRNGGAMSRLRATVVNAIASENFSSSGDDGGFVAEGGAQVAIRDSTATRNFSTGFRAFQSTTPTEMSLDRCLATQNDQGILAGAGFGAGTALIAVSNSTASFNASNGIVAGTNGRIIAFGNTVTKNGAGINGAAGTFDSLGHNAVLGNTTESAGTINSVPTM